MPTQHVDDPVKAAPGELLLIVNSTSVAKTRNGAGAPWTQTYIYLDITLANGTGGAAVPSNPALFAVQTTQGLQKATTEGAYFSLGDTHYDVSTFVHASLCDPLLSIAGSSSLRCSVAVEFDGDVEPAQLSYMTPGALAQMMGVPSAGTDQRSATATIVATPCLDCGLLCTDARVDTNNCGACGKATSPGAVCAGGLDTCGAAQPDRCMTQSESFCTNLKSDKDNCGKCGNSVAYGDCQAGLPVCPQGLTFCAEEQGGICVDLNSNTDHCGKCGNRVVNCDGGQATCSSSSQTFCPPTANAPNGTCADLKSDENNCGQCGHVITGGMCDQGKIACADRQIECGDTCFGETDKLHCGNCTKKCDRGEMDYCNYIEQGVACIAEITASTSFPNIADCATECTKQGYTDCLRGRDAVNTGDDCYLPSDSFDCLCKY